MRYVTDAVNVIIYPTYYSIVARVRAHPHRETRVRTLARKNSGDLPWRTFTRALRLVGRFSLQLYFVRHCTAYRKIMHPWWRKHTHTHTHTHTRDARHIRRDIVIVRNEIYKFHFRYWLFLIRVKFSFLYTYRWHIVSLFDRSSSEQSNAKLHLFRYPFPFRTNCKEFPSNYSTVRVKRNNYCINWSK